MNKNLYMYSNKKRLKKNLHNQSQLHNTSYSFAFDPTIFNSFSSFIEFLLAKSILYDGQRGQILNIQYNYKHGQSYWNTNTDHMAETTTFLFPWCCCYGDDLTDLLAMILCRIMSVVMRLPLSTVLNIPLCLGTC